MHRFHNAEFEFSISNAPRVEGALEEMQKDRPLYLFSGKSNAGKSTLINYITERKNLTRVSKTPGRTTEILFFKADLSSENARRPVYLVDLPGYGFSKTSKKKKTQWLELMESFFQSVQQTALNVLIVDIRRGIGPLDKQMIEYFQQTDAPIFIAFSKLDRLKSRKEKETCLAKLKKDPLLESISYQSYSAMDSKQREELLKEMIFLNSSSF